MFSLDFSASFGYNENRKIGNPLSERKAMSEIVYTCPCGKTYRFNRQFSGRASRCVRCRSEYVVPMASSPILPQNSEQPEPSADADGDFELHPPVIASPPQESPLATPDEAIINAVVADDDEEKEEEGVNVSTLLAPSESAPPKTPKKIFLGKYEIREKIGEGGMGNVFVAWDSELQREVTIKTLNQRGKKHDRFKERFLNEARITGKLEHSGVVPLYHLDYDSKGVPYYVMRLLEGRTLLKLIDQYHHSKIAASSPERLRELLRHFIDVCQTIAYAHDHFVVHRDIKPANVMLGGYGETVVIDWGLSKVLGGNAADASVDDIPEDHSAAGPAPPEEDTPNLTMAGGRLGTFGYQSPEYLRSGISRFSDDIYALGVTLYYLLSDRMPYKVQDHRGLFEKMTTPPVPPHLHNPHVDRPLSAICLCAMAADPEKRYPTAARLAADLQCWLDGETVSVYRMNWKERAKNLLKKEAARIGITLGAFLAGALFVRLLYG